MRSPRHSAGFVTPSNLIIIVVTLALCAVAYVGLGRLGWAWWVRILAIVAGLYALAFGLIFLIGEDAKARKAKFKQGDG